MGRQASNGESKLLPKYLRLLRHLESLIGPEGLRPGDALPTEHGLMAEFSVSRSTVRQALGQLEQTGRITRVQGRGSFVAEPNSPASLLQLQKSFCLIAPELRRGPYPSLVHGFEQACHALQYRAQVANSQNEIARQGDLLLQMIDEQVGGVAIVSPTREPTPTYHVTQLRRNHIPVVFCHRPMERVAAPSLVFSGFETGGLVGERLAELGHRKVAMLFASRYSMVDERLQGLEEAMVRVGGEVLPLEFAPARDATPAETNAAIRRVLDATCGGADRPTAIFCGLTSDAECVYMWAQEGGLRLPDDLSLVCFGSTWHEHGFAEQVATVAVAEQEIGAQAARLLYEMQTGKLPLDCPEQIVFSQSLVRGGTIGPAPQVVRRAARTLDLVEEIA